MRSLTISVLDFLSGSASAVSVNKLRDQILLHLSWKLTTALSDVTATVAGHGVALELNPLMPCPTDPDLDSKLFQYAKAATIHGRKHTTFSIATDKAGLCYTSLQNTTITYPDNFTAICQPVVGML